MLPWILGDIACVSRLSSIARPARSHGGKAEGGQRMRTLLSKVTLPIPVLVLRQRPSPGETQVREPEE